MLNSGFSLNGEARKFFAGYFGVDCFSFTKAMGAYMREVERNADATVDDLIKVLEDPILPKTDSGEEQTY